MSNLSQRTSQAKKSKKIKLKYAKKTKKKTRSQLIKELDKVFSIYIRNRDSDWRGYGKCITCPKTKRWQEMDAGHYISRRFLGTRWNEKNVNIQCKGCNSFFSGRQDEYALVLIRRYGQQILKELNAEKKKEISTKEIIEKTQEYKKLIESL